LNSSIFTLSVFLSVRESKIRLQPGQVIELPNQVCVLRQHDDSRAEGNTDLNSSIFTPSVFLSVRESKIRLQPGYVFGPIILHRNRIALFLRGRRQREVGLNKEPFIAPLLQYGG
jgi:hypothetical protein